MNPDYLELAASLAFRQGHGVSIQRGSISTATARPDFYELGERVRRDTAMENAVTEEWKERTIGFRAADAMKPGWSLIDWLTA